jgi:YVTN family beta-propeller protein
MSNATRGARALVLALCLLTAAPCVAQAGWSIRAHWRGAHAGWLTHARAGSVPTGDGANWVTVDPATRTIYVANLLAGTISVIDASTCNADRTSGCEVVAAIPAGTTPFATAIDARSRTLYASNVDIGAVSVFDVSECNARLVSGCAGARATVDVGGFPLGIALDPASDTVYVGGDGQDPLALLDGATCNGVVTSGCGVVARALIGPAITLPFADPATRTIYVPGTGADIDRLTVLDARACNARVTAGCGGPFATASAGAFAITGLLDPATRTVYVGNADDGTVSVIDAARCNGAVTSGCGDDARLIPVAPSPEAGMAVDQASHTLFVTSPDTDLMTVVDTTHCRAGDGSGCDRDWPALQTGGQPFWTAFDQRTRTLYTANFADDGLGVLDASACSAVRTGGCRDEAPALDVNAGVGNLALSRSHHTVYAADSNEHQVVMLDSNRCTPARCVRRTEPVPGISGPADIAVDDGTDTIYVTSQDDSTVTVLDAATCNVSRSGGCAPVGAPIPIERRPLQVTVDPRSHAVYVSAVESNRLYRIDGAHCRIGDRSRCTPVFGTVGDLPVGVEIDPATSTVYTANDSGTVSVVDGRRCCAAIAAVTVGRRPQDLAFDAGTRTLYVANFGEDEPGTVSVIDTRACNARVTSGCAKTPATLASGRGPLAISVDPERHAVWVGDTLHATVSRLDGRTCNASRTDGCARAPSFTATALFPRDLLLVGDSLYVTSAFDRTVQILPAG